MKRPPRVGASSRRAHQGGRRPAPSPRTGAPGAKTRSKPGQRRRVGAAQAVARSRTGRRLTVFLACYLLLSVAIAYRLVGVQVVSADEYRSLAERQSQRDFELPARRGRIYDRSGDPLAVSLGAATVYANPRGLREAGIDPSFVAADLAPLLDRPMGDLVEALSSDAGFVYLARQLPRAVGTQVRQMRLPSIGVLTEPKRTYPAGSLAAQVIGFAGRDHVGLAGLELQYEELLVGEPGRLRHEGAPGGLSITSAPREVSPPAAGTDIVLTIDRQIQHASERALSEAVERFGAKGGCAVVLDAPTSEILAMACSPTYDPADIGSAEAYARRNRAVTDVFEPGSVNKAITAAAALEEGLVTPDEVFTVGPYHQVGSKRFTDSTVRPERQMTFAEIIAESSNIGTIQTAERLGEERLHEYMQRFGLGSSTGSGFPGESAGLLHDPETWSATSLPTISIGQGVSTTLLQLAGVYQTIANGGEWTQPTFVRGTVAQDGRLDPAEAGERRRAVSEATAETVSDLLAGVVEEGTGDLAAVTGYRVAGKTGTAQKPSETRRGYESGAYVSTFGGFAPVEDPALVVAVMLDEPRPVYYGGLTAAPVFSEIMDFALGYRRVPPSDPQARATGAPAGEAGD